MTPDLEDLRPSILIEIAKAFAKLGSPLDREQLEGMTPAEIYAAAEARGAGIELLSTVGRWGDTLDDVDVLRHMHALNLFAAPVTTDDASLSQPDKPVTHPNYEKGCQEVLAPHLEDLIERAVAAGWDHNKVAFSLMYLAGGHLSLKKQESRAGPA